MATTSFVDQVTTILAAWLNDVDTATYDRLSAVSGTNAIIATGPLSLAAYATGQNFYFTPAVTNTGAVTVNINGLGVKAITKNGAVALVAGDLVAGTVYEIMYDGVQFQVINPSSFSTPIPATQLTGQVAIVNGGTGISSIIPAGQVVGNITGGNIVITPYQGNKVAFPSGYATLPAAGVSVTPTGLTPLTLYYVYLVQTAGVVSSVEVSTTGHSTDTATGIEIKTGDSTRVLAGAVRPIAGPSFINTPAQRFFINWFNPVNKDIYNFFTADRATGSTTLVQLNSASERVEFLTWATKAVIASCTGFASSSAIGAVNATSLAVDGVAQDGGSIGNTAAIGTVAPVVASYARSLSEGYHFFDVFGRVSAASTGTWNGTTAGARVAIQGLIQG